MSSTLERLQVNVASIVIGALLFIIVRVWMETFSLVADNITKNKPMWNDTIRKHLISSSLITFFSVCIIILFYIRANNQ